MANSEIIGAGQCTAHPAPKKILDVCCGTKGMWFDKKENRALFMDKRKEYHKMVHPSGTRTANISPDIIGDFTDIKYLNNSFYLVVFDPPHIVRKTQSGMVTKQYGYLTDNWRDMLQKGFLECFRILKPNGVLIFKWNECSIPVREILELTPEPPLFGHKCGKHLNTHWLCFMKKEEDEHGCHDCFFDFDKEPDNCIGCDSLYCNWKSGKESPVLGEESPALDTKKIKKE